MRSPSGDQDGATLAIRAGRELDAGRAIGLGHDDDATLLVKVA